LNAWAEWVENIDGAEPPGKLSTAGLRDEEGKILKGLRPKIDYRFAFHAKNYCVHLSSLYRGVPPTVYYIYRELYGKDDTPPICRYTVDIYNMPVPDEHMVSISRDPQVLPFDLLSLITIIRSSFSVQLKARVVVNKIREKYVKWGEDEEDEVTSPSHFTLLISLLQEDEWCCCGLTRDHVESILYWILTCGSRSRSGRKNIRYRDYRPLKRSTGDDDTMSEWSVRSNSTLASIQSDHSRASSNTSIGDADRGYGQNSIVRNWVMGMVGYTAH
jgi:hypothetical protein